MNRTWLVTLTREVCRRGRPPTGAPFPDREAYEAWVARALHDRGFDLGMPVDVLRGLAWADEGTYDTYALLNDTAHLLMMGQAVLRWQGAGRAEGEPFLLWAALGLTLDDQELTAAAYGLVDVAEPADREVSELGVLLAGRLRERSLPSEHPLLGHPFHQLLRYQRALRFLRMIWAVAAGSSRPGGRAERADVVRAHGLCDDALELAIRATIALAAADGVIDEDERRLVAALTRAARLDSHATALLEQELMAPATVERLVERITDPVQRAFVLRVLLVTAHVNRSYEPEEEALLTELARGFGVPPDQLDRYEAEALHSYERHETLLEGLSLTGAVRRMRRHLHGRVDRAVRDNAQRLAAEVRETRELVELLAKAGHSELTEAEKRAVRDQITDLCKTIPALALFAVPGGSILLPIAIKHLPFDILPSNFVDRETL